MLWLRCIMRCHFTVTCFTHLTFNSSPLGYSHWVPGLDQFFFCLFGHKPPWFLCFTHWLILPLLVQCLVEGAWYVYFRWRLLLLMIPSCFWYVTSNLPYKHQPFHQDVRLWMPYMSITCDVTLFGRHALPGSQKQRVSSFGHHQFGVRLRL